MKKWKNRKWLCFALAGIMILSLAACGKTPAAGGSAEAETAEQASETSDPNVECIDMEYANGGMKFVRVEKADPNLTDADNAYVFVFDFTNFKDEPTQAQRVFTIQYFQNNVEIKDASSWSSEGGEQYELVGAYFNEALKGGTVTFGQIFVPKDDSPVTVMVKYYGEDEPDKPYQMMEVDLNDAVGSTGEKAAEALSAEEVDALLQGTWVLESGNTGYFIFDNGSISLVSGGTTMDGTYTVNTESGNIDASVMGTDGKVNFHLPYKIADGAVQVFNNNGVAMTKQG